MKTDILIEKCDYSVLLIGDSITQGWETKGQKVWEKNFPGIKPLNFAISADRTEHVLWRLEYAYKPVCKPETAVVLIGTNNQKKNSARQIADAVKVILTKIHGYHPEIKIVLLSILPCGKYPNEQRDLLKKTNSIIKTYADGKRIYFVDVFNQYIMPDGTIPRELLYDYLHPTAEGYEIIATAIKPYLNGL